METWVETESRKIGSIRLLLENATIRLRDVA